MSQGIVMEEEEGGCLAIPVRPQLVEGGLILDGALGGDRVSCTKLLWGVSYYLVFAFADASERANRADERKQSAVEPSPPAPVLGAGKERHLCVDGGWQAVQQDDLVP